jgi:hypothetical protein
MIQKLLKYKYFLLLIPIVIALLFLVNFKGCKEGKAIAHIDTLTIQNNVSKGAINKIDTNIYQRHKRLIQDSINMKLAYNRLRAKYLNALKTLPDTCKSYIDTIYKEALVVDSTDKVMIARLDSTNQDLFVKVLLYKSITHNDTLRISNLSDSLKTEFKRGLRKGRKQGVIVGAAAIECINIGTKFVKP